MAIEPFIHRCTVREGSAAGNKVATSVDQYDYEYGKLCEHCGEPLATTEQLLAHIYGELTDGDCPMTQGEENGR